MTQVDTFETFDKEQMASLTPKSEASKPDPMWSERISALPVGNGFRIRRQEGETVRQLKKKINRAAGTSFRTLEWFPEQKNLPQGEEPTSFVVKVRALDLKAKAEAEEKAKAEAAAIASKNGQNQQEGIQEGQQPLETEKTPDGTPEENASVGPRRGRSA